MQQLFREKQIQRRVLFELSIAHNYLITVSQGCSRLQSSY